MPQTTFDMVVNLPQLDTNLDSHMISLLALIGPRIFSSSLDNLNSEKGYADVRTLKPTTTFSKDIGKAC